MTGDLVARLTLKRVNAQYLFLRVNCEKTTPLDGVNAQLLWENCEKTTPLDRVNARLLGVICEKTTPLKGVNALLWVI